MVNLSDLYKYQESGFVKGFSTESLTAANRLIAAARKATPDSIRDHFRSSIRRDGDGYVWAWVIKG